MLRRILRYYRHPYRAKLLPISVGVGVYFYLLLVRYRPWEVFVHGLKENSLQGIVDWIISILFNKPLWMFLGMSALFWAMVFVGLFFFGQFVLPVRSLEERRAVFTRLVYYAFGFHGPAVFVQDGHLIQSKGESERNGPGVIVLDTASAAVLATEGGYTRAVGPGVVFTKSGERADEHAVLDLRVRSAAWGPLPGEDPFAPQGPDEPDEAYRERQRRRWATSAKTRDGVEVVARIVAVFYLDNNPDGLSQEAYEKGRFHTRFKGHAVSAWKAVVHQPVDAIKVSSAGKRQQDTLLEWGWLPVRVAVDLWREYLQRFRLIDLFMPLNDDNNTALNVILEAVRERMTQPAYREMTAEGVLAGVMLPSEEYKLLQERGIRVKAVVAPSILLPEEAEEQLIRKWSANWLDRAKLESTLVERRRSLAQKEGEDEAHGEFGTFIIEQVCNKAEQEAWSRSRCTERVLKALLEMIQSDVDLYAAQQQEIMALKELWAWVYERAQAERGG